MYTQCNEKEITMAVHRKILLESFLCEKVTNIYVYDSAIESNASSFPTYTRLFNL